MSGLKFKRWDEWEVPPMWMWIVVSVVLIGVSTLVFWKLGESVSAGARASAVPPPPAPTRNNPYDPDSY